MTPPSTARRHAPGTGITVLLVGATAVGVLMVNRGLGGCAATPGEPAPEESAYLFVAPPTSPPDAPGTRLVVFGQGFAARSEITLDRAEPAGPSVDLFVTVREPAGGTPPTDRPTTFGFGDRGFSDAGPVDPCAMIAGTDAPRGRVFARRALGDGPPGDYRLATRFEASPGARLQAVHSLGRTHVLQLTGRDGAASFRIDRVEDSPGGAIVHVSEHRADGLATMALVHVALDTRVPSERPIEVVFSGGDRSPRRTR